MGTTADLQEEKWDVTASEARLDYATTRAEATPVDEGIIDLEFGPDATGITATVPGSTP